MGAPQGAIQLEQGTAYGMVEYPHRGICRSHIPLNLPRASSRLLAIVADTPRCPQGRCL